MKIAIFVVIDWWFRARRDWWGPRLRDRIHIRCLLSFRTAQVVHDAWKMLIVDVKECLLIISEIAGLTVAQDHERKLIASVECGLKSRITMLAASQDASVFLPSHAKRGVCFPDVQSGVCSIPYQVDTTPRHVAINRGQKFAITASPTTSSL
jgi:hypothetical protein